MWGGIDSGTTPQGRLDVTEFEEFKNTLERVVKTPKPPRPKRHWRVLCENCNWLTEPVASRTRAIALGHGHIANDHQDDDEWAFRVQLITDK